MAIVLAWAVAAVTLWLLLTAERSSARAGTAKRAAWLREAALEAEQEAAERALLARTAVQLAPPWQQRNRVASLSDYN